MVRYFTPDDTVNVTVDGIDLGRFTVHASAVPLLDDLATYTWKRAPRRLDDDLPVARRRPLGYIDTEAREVAPPVELERPR